jgi:hypothetical protein
VQKERENNGKRGNNWTERLRNGVKENGEIDLPRENMDFSDCIVFLFHPLFITKHLCTNVCTAYVSFPDFSTAYIFLCVCTYNSYRCI